MNKYEEIYNKIISAQEYKENIQWGKARPGHPEGTIEAHIAQLEENLKIYENDLHDDDEYYKIKILIHVHDLFKGKAERGVPINHPRSHASLARKFLEKYIKEQEILDMVQKHDEPYALWKQFQKNQKYDKSRLTLLLESLDFSTTKQSDPLELFLIFAIIDASSEGKSDEPIRWFLREVKKQKPDVEVDESWLPKPTKAI